MKIICSLAFRQSGSQADRQIVCQTGKQTVKQTSRYNVRTDSQRPDSLTDSSQTARHSVRQIAGPGFPHTWKVMEFENTFSSPGKVMDFYEKWQRSLKSHGF